MNLKYKYAIGLLISLNAMFGQVSELNISNGSCQLFKGNLYCYGFSQNKTSSAFCVYKLDFKLNKTDSFVVTRAAFNPEKFLLLYSDTLHDFLNIYLQEKESKLVSIFRFNKSFELIAEINHVEVARLNNSAMFGADAFYSGSSVYSIKTQADSSGIQFFLNKHELKSGIKNFDYEQTWQFAFERKYIHSVRVFMANAECVLAYVKVNGGLKNGQWILKINAQNGKLIKGTRVNEKTESSHYFFGNYMYNKSGKSCLLIGQKLSETQYNKEQYKLTITNAAGVSLFLVEIDSTGEVTTRREFKIPIKEQLSGVKKVNSAYIVRLAGLAQENSERMSIETDIYKSNGEALCFYYVNTMRYFINKTEDNWVMEKSQISPDLLVEQFYRTNDKLDINGKVCVDSLDQLERLFYKNITLPVKQLFKNDDLNNSYWVLKKSNLSKNVINFSLLVPEKKQYVLKVIEEIKKSQNPVFTKLSGPAFLLSYQTEEGRLRLKLFSL